MKVIKRYKLSELPEKKYVDGNWVSPTGYAVKFDDESYAVEYEDSNFEYTDDCVTVDGEEMYEKLKKLKEEKLIAFHKEVADEEAEPKPEEIEKEDKETTKKCVEGVVSLSLFLIGNSFYRKNKGKNKWKVFISLLVFFTGFVGLADSVKYVVENSPWKKEKKNEGCRKETKNGK